MTPSVKQRRSGLALLVLLAAPVLTGPASAASPFDGRYVGPMKATTNDNSGYCKSADHDKVLLVVKDGIVKYKWGVDLEATVAADGSFSDDKPGMMIRGASPTISIKGKITGPKLEADVGSTRCAAHLSLTKS